MRDLMRFLGQRLVMELARTFRIKREIELILPAELETRTGKCIIAELRCRMTLRKIGCMSGNLVGDDAFLHILPVRQAEMFLGRHITKHRRTKPADHGRADAARYVVITRRNVGRERPKRVERRATAMLELLVHIDLDLVHRHMTRPLDHHLTALCPGDLRQFAQRFQFGKLRFVICVGNGARAKPVTQREGNIILPHDVADFLEMFVEETFLVMREAPLRHDGAPTADNAGNTLCRKRHIGKAHTSMDGEIVHALLCLLDQRVAINLPCEIFGNAIHLLERLIDRHSADGNGGIADDPFACVVNIAAC